MVTLISLLLIFQIILDATNFMKLQITTHKHQNSKLNGVQIQRKELKKTMLDSGENYELFYICFSCDIFKLCKSFQVVLSDLYESWRIQIKKSLN